MAFALPLYAGYLGATVAAAALSAGVTYAWTRPATTPYEKSTNAHTPSYVVQDEEEISTLQNSVSNADSTDNNSAIQAQDSRLDPTRIEESQSQAIQADEKRDEASGAVRKETPVEVEFASPKEVQTALNAEMHALLELMVRNIDRAMEKHDGTFVQNGERLSFEALKKTGALRTFRRGSETQPVLSQDQMLRRELDKKFAEALQVSGFRSTEDFQPEHKSLDYGFQHA